MDIKGCYEAIKTKLIEGEYSFIEDAHSNVFVITTTVGMIPKMEVFITCYDKPIIEIWCCLVAGDIEKEETKNKLIAKLNELNSKHKLIKFVVHDNGYVYAEYTFMFCSEPVDVADYTMLIFDLIKISCDNTISEILEVLLENE